MRTDADIESFVNDLDTDEVGALVTLVAKLDPLEVTSDGTPVYSADEINLIQRFLQFATDHPVEDNFDVVTDPDGLEAEDLNGTDDESGDMPGTGEDIEAEVPADNGGPSDAEEVVHRI